MSDNISQMNIRELRNEVQGLRDELAIFKRKYEDMIYNLDTDNFSGNIIKEKNGMKAELKVTAEAVSSKVSKGEMESRITQTAGEIQTQVTKTFEDRINNTKTELESSITQTAEGIQSQVTSLSTEHNTTKENVATLTQTAEKIETQVSALSTDLRGTKTKFESSITQTAEKIGSIVREYFDTSKAVVVHSKDDFADPTKIYSLQGDFYYFNTIKQDWEIVPEDSEGMTSIFEQTSDGFKLRGDVRIDGSCILTDSLTFNSSDRPLEVQYSPDCVTWYDSFTSGRDKYMQLKIGAVWSDPMKIVGDDGQPGSPGSNATVTASKVFDILTNGGTTQGLFPAFYDGGDHLFINAEYIKSGTIDAQYISTDIAQVAKELSIGGQNINDEKVISFNAGAKIKTFLDYLGNPPTGLEISCSSISFDGLGYESDSNSPYVFANDKLLATQDWVRANAGSGGSGGTVVAVFG